MDFKCAFVTGGTGLLGASIIKELLQSTSAKVVLLVRNVAKKKRTKLFNDILAFNGGNWSGGLPYRRVQIVEGDVTLPGLGIAPEIKDRLVKEIDIIYHAAAVIKLSGSEAEVKATNVTGTRNVLDFALQCKEKGRLEKVVHVSTIGVAGDFEGTFYENDLDVGQEFNNAYEKSKFEAEKIVEEYREKDLNILILRPSMIVGDSHTGFTNHFNMFYFQLRLLSQGIIDVMPFYDGAMFNLVPADFAAKAICLISYNSNSENKNFHIVNTHEVGVKQFVEKTCEYLGSEKPDLVSTTDLCLLPSTAFDGVRGKVLSIYYPYISRKKVFDASNTYKALQLHKFSWPPVEDSLLTNILDACIFSGYLRLGSEVAGERSAN